MIYVTKFDIISTLKSAHASRVHTKYIFTAHAMTDAEKEALVGVYAKQYSDGDWHVKHIDINCTIINGGETQ